MLDDLPKGFALEEGDLQRQDKPVIPLRVIREALVNALMHRSYRSHSPVQIIRYANRLEIRNPGFSLKSPEHLGEPGSQPRNPKIAAALYDTRFAETKGSGIRVMRESMEQAGLTPPLFESDRGNDQFVARYFFHHFLGADDMAWLARFKDAQLSRRRSQGAGRGARGRRHRQRHLPRPEQGGHPRPPAPPCAACATPACWPKKAGARPPTTCPPSGWAWATQLLQARRKRLV